MKKLFVLLLAILMIFVLAACGDNEESNVSADKQVNETVDTQDVVEDTIDDVVENVIDEAEEFDSFSVEAVEHYFSNAAGLSVSAVEPDWAYTIGDNHAYGDDPSSGYGHAVIKFTKTGSEVTDDEYRAWLEKVFNATASVSQDGYNVIGYEFVGDGEDAFSETTLDDAIGGFMSGWAFKYNDKLMVVYVSEEYDNDKESELGSLFYYDGVKVDIGVGLQQSFDDAWSDMEEYFEENEDEIKDAIDDYLG